MVEFLGVRIKSLKLTDHPVLGDLELDFTIGSGDRVADNIIIAGENGCGKTTLLNVINGFFQALASGKFTNDDRYHTALTDLLRSPPVTNPYTIEIELCDLWKNSHHVQLLKPEHLVLDSSLSEDEQNIRMALESAKIRIENSKLVFNERTLDENLVADLGIRSILRELKTFFIKSDFDLKTKPIESISSPNQMNSYAKSSDAQAIKELFIVLGIQEGLELKKKLNQVSDKSVSLKKAIDENYKSTLDIFTKVFDGMDLGKGFKEIRRDYSSWDVVFTSKHSQDTEILIEDLSSGEKQIVFKGVYFLGELAKYQDRNNKINSTLACFIDEPEISMHPRWQKKILNFYKGLLSSNNNGKQTSQIFMATHSPFIIHEANLKTDKVIVLKKDDTGKIIVDKNPLFERCDGERFIEAAFNIDNFRKTNKPLVITEGKTDKKILETAWEKLYLNVEMPFEILDAGTHPNAKNRDGGAKELNEQLRYICNFPPHHKIIGMFDNDGAGNDQFNGLQTGNDGWKILTPKISNLEETLVYKKHPKNEVYAILLPIPSHREIYKKPNTQLSDYLCIEHYFNDSVLNTNSLQGPTQVTGTSIFQIGDENKKKAKKDKTKFATETIQTLSPENFSSFKILFDALERLLELSSEQ